MSKFAGKCPGCKTRKIKDFGPPKIDKNLTEYGCKECKSAWFVNKKNNVIGYTHLRLT